MRPAHGRALRFFIFMKGPLMPSAATSGQASLMITAVW